MRRRRLPRRLLTRSVRDPSRKPRTGRAWRKATSLSEASSAGLGWHYEAGLQFVRLVLAGVFDRFPGLQVILGHWGEVVLFYLERMVGFDRAAKLKRPFADYARQNLYVTASGMFSETYLEWCVEIVGIDRILFSTDYPYQYRPGRDARRFLERTPLDAAGKAKLAHANWERLTGRGDAAPPELQDSANGASGRTIFAAARSSFSERHA
jgi:predicted TIM-barrel fold metal-dependent hydrolase